MLLAEKAYRVVVGRDAAQWECTMVRAACEDMTRVRPDVKAHLGLVDFLGPKWEAHSPCAGVHLFLTECKVEPEPQLPMKLDEAMPIRSTAMFLWRGAHARAHQEFTVYDVLEAMIRAIVPRWTATLDALPVRDNLQRLRDVMMKAEVCRFPTASGGQARQILREKTWQLLDAARIELAVAHGKWSEARRIAVQFVEAERFAYVFVRVEEVAARKHVVQAHLLECERWRQRFNKELHLRDLCGSFFVFCLFWFVFFSL